ncbi:MAG: DUF2314 domain-containing protein [Pseudomonadota bacterium]
MIKQTRLLAASLLASGMVACGPSERITATPEGGQIIERSGKVDIVVTDVTTQMHEDAVAEARATFDHFLTMQAAQLPGYGQFAAKVALPTRDGSKEHIWVNGIKRSKGAFSGVLNNDPYNLADDLKIGDRVTFSVEQLTDWGYSESGRQRGHFTTRLLAQQMPEADRKQLLAMLHTSPMPKVISASQ